MIDLGPAPLGSLVRVQGKAALVTGGAAGIGKAIAYRLTIDLSSCMHGSPLPVDGGFLSK